LHKILHSKGNSHTVLEYGKVLVLERKMLQNGFYHQWNVGTNSVKITIS
jgi:hypothetical protein